jgi:hypothetical protein
VIRGEQAQAQTQAQAQPQIQVQAQAGGGPATPLVIGEGPRARGRESAVFPQVRADPRTPPPQVRQPYQPPSTPPPMPTPQAQAQAQPQAQPRPTPPPYAPLRTPPPYTPQQPQQPQAPQQWNGAPAHTPPPGPAYAYPHQQQQRPPQQQQPTPPPYTMRPNGPVPPPRRGGGGGSTVVIAIGAVAAVIALIVVIVLIAHASSEKSTSGSGDASPTTAATAADYDSATPDPYVSQGDRTRTVDTSQCTDPTDSYLTEGAVLMPDFYTKYVDSVKDCMDAAGWNYTVKYQDEAVYGKGTVVGQKPEAISDLDPDQDTVTIWVSTGQDS